MGYDNIYEITGIERANGDMGIRDHLAVIATVFCANHVVDAIAGQIPNAVPITHSAGCGQLGTDADQTRRILKHMGAHPNVGGVLYVGLGCEQHSPHDLKAELTAWKKPVEALVIQDAGGTTASIQAGVTLCKRIQGKMDRDRKKAKFPLSRLVVALECGGSDFSSGMVSNPTLGKLADLLVTHGASVLFGETCETIGAEHLLARRCETDSVKKALLDRIGRVEASALAMRVDMRGSQPSPGNMAGGLSTIEEKSLGAICKSGSSPIVDVLDYGEPVRKKGVNFMDCPGQDLTSICGMVAGGAHLVLFTTGRGTPLGFATAPVIKITANKQAATRMAENMDVDLSGVMEGRTDIETASGLLLETVLATVKGSPTAAERLGHREFGFHATGPTL